METVGIKRNGVYSYHSIQAPSKKDDPINFSINTDEDQSMPSRSLSPDDILSFIGFGPFQILAFCLSGLTYFAYGFDLSIFVFIEDSVTRTWNITKSDYSFLPAATAIPNVIGALGFSFISDKFGRVWPYALCIGWMGTVSICSAFANSFYLLIALRCLTSVAIGGVPGFGFPTVIEFLPVNRRAPVAVLNMLMASVGLCCNYGLAWLLIPSQLEMGWRYYIAGSALPCFLVVAFRLVFYFQSPRYLIANGKHNKAWKVFNTIAKMNRKKLTDFITMSEFNNCLTINADENQSTKQKPQSIFVQLLKIFHPKYLRRTVPLSIILVTQSFGFLSSQLFLPDFLKKLNVGTYFTLLVTAIAQIPGILLLSIIVDWPEFGRLNSLRLFSALASLFFLLLSLIQTTASIPVFLILIYFSTSPIYGLLYTYISECYPTSIRSITTSYFFIIQALTYMVGALGSDKAANVSQHWLFPAIFAIVYFVQLCVSLVLNYEPRGRKLKDVM